MTAELYFENLKLERVQKQIQRKFVTYRQIHKRKELLFNITEKHENKLNSQDYDLNIFRMKGFSNIFFRF